MSNIFELVEQDDIEALKQLVSEGEDLHQLNKNTETLMHIAAQHNSVRVLRYLIKQNLDINAKTESQQETPIFYAIDQQNREAFNLLVKNGAKLDEINANGDNILEIATRKNLPEFVDLLLKKGCKLNHANQKGETAFDICFDVEDTNVIGIFLAQDAIDEVDKMGVLIVDNSPPPPRRARNYEEQYSDLFEFCAQNDAENLANSIGTFDINMQFFDGETLLHCAVENNALDCCRVLLDNGADPNVQRLTFGDTPLVTAIENGNADICDLLIERGANLELPNAEGETMIFTALRAGDPGAVKALCASHANINAINSEGYTPLQVAIILHETQIAILLVQEGASASLGSINSYSLALKNGEFDICSAIREKDPTLARQATRARSAIQQSPPHKFYSLVKTRNIKGLKKVLEDEYDLSTQTPDGVPLFKAIDSGNLEVVKLLVNAGADVDAEISNYTPLMYACKSGNLDIVRYLISQGADPRYENSEGESALFSAIRSNKMDVITEILNSSGIDINMPNANGLTPLYIAVGLKNKPVIKQLIAAGADPNVTGHSPYKLAHDMKNEPIMNILRESGAKSHVKRVPRMTRLQEAFLSKTGKPVIISPFGKNQKVLSRATTPTSQPGEQCYICGSKRNLVKLVPCGHHCTCWACAPQFAEKYTQCPICQLNFFATKK